MGGTKAHLRLCFNGEEGKQFLKTETHTVNSVSLPWHEIPYFSSDYRVNTFLMVKFFIITDILHFFPLVGVSLSLFSFCNLPSLSSYKDFQWSRPPNCSKRLWREAQDGNLETFSCWQRPTFNIFWQLFLWSNSCIFLAFSNIFFNVGDTNTLHILLLFKSLGPCNQRSTCRLTLTCFR